MVYQCISDTISTAAGCQASLTDLGWVTLVQQAAVQLSPLQLSSLHHQLSPSSSNYQQERQEEGVRKEEEEKEEKENRYGREERQEEQEKRFRRREGLGGRYERESMLVGLR